MRAATAFAADGGGNPALPGITDRSYTHLAQQGKLAQLLGAPEHIAALKVLHLGQTQMQH